MGIPIEIREVLFKTLTWPKSNCGAYLSPSECSAFLHKMNIVSVDSDMLRAHLEYKQFRTSPDGTKFYIGFTNPEYRGEALRFLRGQPIKPVPAPAKTLEQIIRDKEDELMRKKAITIWFFYEGKDGFAQITDTESKDELPLMTEYNGTQEDFERARQELKARAKKILPEGSKGRIYFLPDIEHEHEKFRKFMENERLAKAS